MGKNKAVVIDLEGGIDLSPVSAYDAAKADGYSGTEEQYGKELAIEPVSQEEFDALPGRLVKMTTTTEVSDSHHITDSAADKVLDFGMEGITEQETVPGNQLLPYPYRSTSSDIFTDNGDGSVTVNATNDGGIQYYWLCGYPTADDNPCLLPAGTYTFDDVGCDDRVSRYSFAKYKDDGSIQWLGSLSTYTFTEDTKIRIAIQITSGKTVNTTFRPMLNKGTTVLPWEPYTGGVPSPSPDYPQEIVNAGVLNEETGRYEIGCKVLNKNWFDKEWILDFSTYDHTDGAYARKYFYLEPNTKYRVVMFKKPITYKNAATVFLGTVNGYDNSNANGLVTLMSYGVTTEKTESVVFTTDDTGKCIIKSLAYVYADLVELVDKNEVMIYKYDGVADDTYVPYHSQPLTLTSDRPLTKWDKLVKRDGVWGWSVWSGHDVITGDVGICNKVANFVAKFEMQSTKLYGHKQNYVSDRYCNIAKSSSWGDSYRTFAISSYSNSLAAVWINFGSEEMTVEDCRARLNETPMEIWCKSAIEVTFIPLPDEEQTLLNNLETYYGVTNVYNEQGCPMWLTYVQDAKIAVDNKFNNIRTALVSLGANV